MPREVALAVVKDDLSKYLRLADVQEIVITRRESDQDPGRSAKSDEDWFEYRLEHHPEFLRRISEARAAIGAGRGVALDDV